ncbi:poly(A) polymerase alpha-like [Tetranychus urticae]|uniref:polynucleotide adenylyltransferase n=1 Tax=Tetranychus urticae TaxID=32264 RepID=T1KTR8_TETUR|nr:poly(A) polymerase alpha-like [Tetranychus urticae]
MPETEVRDVEKILRKSPARQCIHHSRKIVNAIQLIERTVNSILVGCLLKENIPRNEIRLQSKAKVIIVGSHLLNAALLDSDVDLLIVIPACVHTFHVISDLPPALSKVPDFDDVQLHRMHINLIQLNYGDIKIDITVARYPDDLIPDNIYEALSDDSILQRIDGQSREILISLNTSYAIYKATNSKLYSDTLRAIKYWAKRRKIYFNIFGFVSGVGLAILLSKIYISSNSSTIEELMSEFFNYYASYDWSRPVVMFDSNLEIDDSNFDDNPKMTKLFILAPIKEYRNVCKSVTNSHAYIFQLELKRAKMICDKVNSNRLLWESLFAPYEFFNSYKHFVLLVGCFPSYYFGRVKGEIKILAERLEDVVGLGYTHLSAFDYDILETSKNFVDKPDDSFTRVLWSIGLSLNDEESNIEDITGVISSKLKDFVADIRFQFRFPITSSPTVYKNTMTAFLIARRSVPKHVSFENIDYKFSKYISNESRLQNL